MCRDFCDDAEELLVEGASKLATTPAPALSKGELWTVVMT